MHDSRLVKMLQLLSKKELRQFKKYIHSPFFNTNGQLTDLFDYIHQYYPNWASRMLDKEHVYRYLFPDAKAFQAKKMSNLMSELSLQIEDFLVQLEFTNNKIEQKKLRAEALGKRNLTSSLKKTFHKLDKDLNNAPAQDLSYFLSQFQKNHKLYFDHVTQKFNPDKEVLSGAMKNLDSFYLLAKLQLSIEMKSRERVYDEDYSIRFLNEIISISIEDLKGFSPLLIIYYHLMQLTLFREQIDYFKAKETYIKSWQSFKTNDQLFILLTLLNFATRQSNAGNKGFIKEKFDLNKFGLENYILISNGRLSEALFLNIIINGIKLEEYNWLQTYLNNYVSYLDDEIQEQIKVLSEAIIHYSKREYTNTRQLITSHSFPKPIHKIRAKSLLLRAIYEELAFDETQYILFISQSQSFERFLRRKEQLTEKDLYINFIQILRQLAKKRYNNSISTSFIKKMKDRITENQRIANKPWILEKIEEL